MRSWRGPSDLVSISLLTLGALACVALPVPDPVKALAAFLLVFLLPGSAIAAAIFATSDLPRAVVFSFTVIFSIGALALGSLFLQLFFRLDLAVFAVLLAVVTGISLGVARARHGTLELWPGRNRLGLSWPNVVAVLVLIAAIVIAGVAIKVATDGQHRQLAGEHFTALSMVPERKKRASAGIGPLRVAVGNHEGRTLVYTLEVSQGNASLHHWRIRLASEHQWSSLISQPPADSQRPIVARLLLDGVQYRQVALNVPITS